MTDFQAGTDAFAAATKSLQAFTEETQRMAQESMDEAMQVMEKLASVRSIPEVMALQTSLMQSSMARYSAYTRRIAELMAASSSGMFRL